MNEQRHRTRGALLAASALFATSTVYGTRVGLRENLPGEPLGLRVSGRVGAQLAWGWGAGTAAPWPMPVAALTAALRAGTGSAGPATACLVLGTAVLVGTLIEPATWGRRSRSPDVSRTVALNLLSGAALVAAGRQALMSR